ncbi:carbohydrate ABC transporter permease [Paenibacillus thalictri]|uniref:Carbohydrate ABC transporter permease n=1 Tax=Paenibacillus thalictri TaxID=2527873 RepID=A0A4Q9DIV3_9BACL|nr:carbohydrate ABC transporter permease [Paenibacillus thalictri]TBL73269.1 carbohydrate ABC transporter permease [Paenibacillus thalictri]
MLNQAWKKTLLLLLAAGILIPVSLVFITSFKEQKEYYMNPVGFPQHFSFSNYMEMFTQQKIGQYFMNSVIVTLSTVVLILFFGTMIAFAITRISGVKGLVVYGLFAAGMMVPGQVNMIAIYSLVLKLGLTNSLTGLILVSIAVFIPIAVFIISGFMKTLSKELFEASGMDGASEWVMYSRIALPVAMPSVAATAIFLFVMVWNDLMHPLLFISDKSKKTMPLALLQLKGEYITNFPAIFAGVVIASMPMVVAYLFLQRFFVAGITAGSVKG